MRRGRWSVKGVARRFLGTALFTLLSASLRAVEVQPVINADLLLGQYWYNGADSKVGGMASLSASPYLKFNDRWSLVPLYQGKYQGVAQVTDFTGGGTLFNDSQDHTISVKGIRQFGEAFKLKAIAGYGLEWLRETEDEDWTEGLYDNRRCSFGTEGEYAWSDRLSLRLAYDYYALRFPNYQSLESSQVDEGLGRELAEPDVLDNGNHRLMLAGQAPVFLDGWLDWMVSQTWRSFPDQHLVNASGNLSADTRSDQLLNLGLDGTWPVLMGERNRLFGSLGYGLAWLNSNQNSYDASKTTYRPNFYDHTTHVLQTRWTLLFGESDPPSLTASALISRQDYADRLIQDAEGTYGTDSTRVESMVFGLSGTYPIAKNFQLKARADFGWNDSNNTYTRVYQYHYNTQSYLLGFSYAY